MCSLALALAQRSPPNQFAFAFGDDATDLFDAELAALITQTFGD